ncbi:unnamed protein product, partial [Sphacelaria rigidula]
MSNPLIGSLHGNLSMRVSSPGKLVFHLYVGRKLISTTADSVEVEACPEEVTIATSPVVHNSSHACDSGGEDLTGVTSLRSFFAVNGVLA